MHKPTSGAFSRARWLLPAAAFALLGCPKQELAPLGPCTVSAVTERVDQTGVDQVDLLFVIDNSGSMASEQVGLGRLLPELVKVLTTGDKTPDEPEEPRENNDRYFTPVRSLHIGVVTTNMGGVDDPYGGNVAINSCKDLGDDGKLQNDTTIAEEGVVASTNREFDGYEANEVVLPPDPSCNIPNIPRYQTFMSGGDADPDEVAERFRCISRVGVRGCPFEQQLEAMWKALAPSTPPDDVKTDDDKDLYKFLNGTTGQGTRSNEGFLRDEAILAVMHVSDEEDCSLNATKEDAKLLFDNTPDSEAEMRYTNAINLRCGKYGEAENLVWPAERYVRGLRSLKPDYPDRIIFGAIVGIPTELREDVTIDDILKREDMQFKADPNNPMLPNPSCLRDNPEDRTKTDKAYPPRRFLQVAKEFGENAVLHSICAEDYKPALDRLIERIAKQLKGNCLPRQLRPNAEGIVECRVYELLNNEDTTCVKERGHADGPPEERTIRESGRTVKRKACLMNQVPVINNKPAAKAGWYYDDFSPDLEECNEGEKQRIAFTFGELPSGAGATFECFQPVAKVDVSAKGFDAVNTRCTMGESTDNLCPGRSDDTYKMICFEPTKTCQIDCQVDPDCPPGWVCDKAVGSDDPTKFCQQPTCQAGSGGGSTGDDDE